MNKNYKLQNTKKTAHELHELTRISEKKETTITTIKGSHGLHRGSFKLQSMTALIKSFCGGLFAKRKAQSAKRIIQLTLCAKRQALCAFPLVAKGSKKRNLK
jgi:hypothetical protein